MSQPLHVPLNVPVDKSEVSCDVEAASSHRPRCKDYRALAISSIICGISCLGIISLIYSVKVREMNKRSRVEDIDIDKAKGYERKACKWGIIAIVAWVSLLILIPLLMGLVSFLLTFIN